MSTISPTAPGRQPAADTRAAQETAPPGPTLANPARTKALRALADLPPFSPIMNRLLASLAGEDISFAKLGDLIEKDAVIAGNLLHVVNSAMYARRSSINSVRHAVSVLGVGKLRNVVLGMSVANLWNRTRVPLGWSMKRFNMHSAAVAILGDLLAQRLSVAYPEGAFAAGLFHDLGQLLIAIALPQESLAIHQQVTKHLAIGLAAGPSATLVQCEEDLLGFSHAALSADALAAWKLPWPVQAAVASHHDEWPAAALDPAGNRVASPEEIPLGRLVDAANRYVNSTGNTISQDPRAATSSPDLIGSLGLAPDVLARLLAEFREEYMSMAQFFI